MAPYYCVIYKVSDTRRRNFANLAEAKAFKAIVGGEVWLCDKFGTQEKKVDKE